jgi:hypothetical protein
VVLRSLRTLKASKRKAAAPVKKSAHAADFLLF